MSKPQAPSPAQDVHKRQVFYLPGYDPMVPRRYRELYRTEGTKQAAISGYTLDIKGITGLENYAWSVQSDINGTKTHSTVEFMLWSDIVAKSMDRGIIGTYLLLLKTVWIYISTGALFRLMGLRAGPIIAALYPVFMLLLQLAVAVALGWGVGFVANFFFPLVLSWGLGLAILPIVLRWFKSKDGKIYAYYLLHDYGFSAQYYGANPAELESRMESFADRIIAALDSDVDEVLVVGHSSGAHLGVSVLSDLIRRHKRAANGPKLAFLTLGQVIPMVSFLPQAHRLRGDLNFLSQQNDITWVDVTAPGDGCSFALCDPVSVSGAAPAAGLKRWPLVFSAAFSQSLSPELFSKLKRRFFRIHFQYLCAFDRPKDYDYFQITAGPLSLGTRFKYRTPSRSRIEKPLSAYQSLVAAK